MRISDWSSDGCSSDLTADNGAGPSSDRRRFCFTPPRKGGSHPSFKWLVVEAVGSRGLWLIPAAAGSMCAAMPAAAATGAFGRETLGLSPVTLIGLVTGVWLVGAAWAVARSIRWASERSDERRVGKACVRTCRSRSPPDDIKKHN